MCCSDVAGVNTGGPNYSSTIKNIVPDRPLRIGQAIRAVRALDPQFNESLPSVLKQWKITQTYKGVAIDNPAELIATYALDRGILADKLHGLGKNTITAAAENIAYIRYHDAVVPLHLTSYWPLSDPSYSRARACMENLKQDPIFYEGWLDVLQKWDSTGSFLGVKAANGIELFVMYSLSVGIPTPALTDLGQQTVTTALKKLYLVNNPSWWNIVPSELYLILPVAAFVAGVIWWALTPTVTTPIPTPPPLPPVDLPNPVDLNLPVFESLSLLLVAVVWFYHRKLIIRFFSWF